MAWACTAASRLPAGPSTTVMSYSTSSGSPADGRPRPGSSQGLWGDRRAAPGLERDHILVLQEPLRVAVGDGGADVALLEERGPGDEPAAANAGDQGGAFLVQAEAGVDACGGDHAGDVDEFAVAAVGAGGDGDDAAGAKDRGGAGEDLGEPVGQFVVVAVGEVCRVAAVLVMDFAHLAPAGAGGADVAVGGCPVRRGRDHQRDAPVEVGWDQDGKVPGVTLYDLAGAGGALGSRKADV